ncbi:MAG: hypothetical protein LBM98_04335 [Oscillospiraceae bacterium]|jgi:hypothetical protein|nr:hypothetical protein [Oscillospiraceae bacterium]
MKKALALVIVVVIMTAVMTPCFLAGAAPGDVPPDLAGATVVGTWPAAAGTYDPSLDTLGIPTGADVFLFMDAASFTATPAPAAIAGFTAVTSLADLAEGSYFIANVNGFEYAIVAQGPVTEAAPAPAPAPAAPAGNAPAELGTALLIGVWPAPAGTYDPTLDTVGIPGGAQVWGLFDAMTYAALPAPGSIAGYTSVGSAAEVTEGTYAIANVNGFDYAILGVPGTGSVEVPVAPAAPAAPVAPPVGATGPQQLAAFNTKEEAGNIYFTASVNGTVEVAAEPIPYTKGMTAVDALVEAHKKWYSGGESGFAGGIDSTYNMYLITTAWGIAATPAVMVNGMPQGHPDLMGGATSDKLLLSEGDNVVLIASSGLATYVSVEGSVDGDNVTLTGLTWVLDFSTFTWAKSPFKGQLVTADGTELGDFDEEGQITIPTSQGTVILSVKPQVTASGKTLPGPQSTFNDPITTYPIGQFNEYRDNKYDYSFFGNKDSHWVAPGEPFLLMLEVNVMVTEKESSYKDAKAYSAAVLAHQANAKLPVDLGDGTTIVWESSGLWKTPKDRGFDESKLPEIPAGANGYWTKQDQGGNFVITSPSDAGAKYFVQRHAESWATTTEGDPEGLEVAYTNKGDGQQLLLVVLFSLLLSVPTAIAAFIGNTTELKSGGRKFTGLDGAIKK